jgi:uncharacterized protein with HEPN domain
MVDAAREALRSAKEHTRADLDGNRVWALGLVKCVEIIGEAAARISEATKERWPQIPWVEIVAMRNRLVHVYFDVDLDQVWKAVTEDLPPLVGALEKILEAERES